MKKVIGIVSEGPIALLKQEIAKWVLRYFFLFVGDAEEESALIAMDKQFS